MRASTRAVVYAVLLLVLGFALAWGLSLYVMFVLDERECVGRSWLGRATCGDSAYTVIAVCVGIAAVLVVSGHYLARRVRRPMRR